MGAGGGAADGSEARGKPSAARRLSARLAARDPAKTKAYLDLYAPVPDGGPGVPSCPGMCPIDALDPLFRLEFYLDESTTTWKAGDKSVLPGGLSRQFP